MIQTPKNQKNSKYRDFWETIESRLERVKKSTELNYNETDITMIIVLLSRCKNKKDLKILKNKINTIAKRMDFYDVE